MIETVVNVLVRTQNADGGWGAMARRRSNTEATALSLLGLSAWDDAAPASSLERANHWLGTRQRPDGSWSFTDQLEQASSWATALAVLALGSLSSGRPDAVRGARWLLGQKGSRLGWIASLLYRVAPDAMSVPLNPDLQGWSWAPETFSWVEPTAYAMIALQKLRPWLPETRRADDRILEGEQLLYDRMCRNGGWNYGNAEVLGENLWPYLETTAVALIALQRHEASESNRRSLGALHSMLAGVDSGFGLSWAILCLGLYGRPVSSWRERLSEQYGRTGFFGETRSLALALLALGEGGRFFKVSYDA